MNDMDSSLSSQVSRAVPKTMDSMINWRLILLVVMFVATIFIAIKTVVHRHESRALFVEIQKLDKERDVLAAQWSRLKLEQGTVLNQMSVERQARWELGMKMPKTSEIEIVREPVKTMLAEEAVSPAIVTRVTFSD